MKKIFPMDKLAFLYNFGFYTRKIPKNWKKQSVHLFFSFFLNAQIFFLLFVKYFSQVHSVEKKALEPFWNFSWPYGHSKLQNWVPSPIFSTSWTWKIIFSQQRKIFSLSKEKNKWTKYYFTVLEKWKASKMWKILYDLLIFQCDKILRKLMEK